MSLRAILKASAPALISLSGGTDSMTLLAAFVKEGLPVSAATVRSEFTPPEEILRADNFSRKLGAEWKVFDVSVLSDEHLRSNPKDRCYLCKKQIMQTLLAAADGKTVCDGTHADDADEERPGKKALKELGIVSPFALCGLGKSDILAMAKELGVPVYPASSCLATRIPFGEVITAENLKIIAESEAFLRKKGIQGVLRVRLFGGDGVIETGRDEMACAELYKEDLKTFGFATISFKEYKTGGGNAWSGIEQ